MQRDEIHLRNILSLVEEIEALLKDENKASFQSSDATRSAVLLKLIFIGEATRYISDDLRSRYPKVRWRRIVGFRNITVHRYWAVDWDVVWTTATSDATAYGAQVQEILTSEFAEAGEKYP